MDHIVINKTVAKEYGINIAIILNNFAFWDKINKSNKSEYHYRDGKWWIYYSCKSLSETLEILTERQIETALAKMIESGLIETSAINYNQSKFDQTKWYSVTQKGLNFFVPSIPQNVESTSHKEGISIPQNVKPIPDGNHRENTNGNHLAAPAHGNVNAIPASPNIRPNLKIKIPDDIREAAYTAWLEMIQQKNMQFTKYELMAIKAYAYSKPNKPMHEIESDLYQLEKWALLGKDVEDCLRGSLTTKSLIHPRLRVETDAKNNRIYNIDTLNVIRQNQLDREKAQRGAA